MRETTESALAAIPNRDPHLEPDLIPVLHEELRLLPEKYRSLVLLCYMEGKRSRPRKGLPGYPNGPGMQWRPRKRHREGFGGQKADVENRNGVNGTDFREVTRFTTADHEVLIALNGDYDASEERPMLYTTP